MTSKAIKMDDTTYDRLKALGTARQRSPHWLMKEAIKQFLDREEEAENRRKDTLKRIAKFEETGESIPFETVDAWLATWGSENEVKPGRVRIAHLYGRLNTVCVWINQ